jgi:hypothetical protein
MQIFKLFLFFGVRGFGLLARFFAFYFIFHFLSFRPVHALLKFLLYIFLFAAVGKP